METKNATVDGEKIVTMSGANTPSAGSVGLETQLPGEHTTVSEVANATGGISAGNLIEPDVDSQLYQFESDDTPLMQLMLYSKKVAVTSPEVEHFMLDEPKYNVTTTAAVAGGDAQAVLSLDASERKLPQLFQTLLVKGVNGYTPDGKTETVGRELMLFVTGSDPTTNNPIVIAVNGPKDDETSEVCNVPAIAAGTVCVLMSNACYETQKWVKPDTIVPKPEIQFLQKRIMNDVVSDYFDSQKKHIPFQHALIAEQAIRNFKTKTNRTLWAGRKAKIKVETPLGMQYVYFTEGVRWQFKRELTHNGDFTYDDFIAIAKMFYTGEDVPKSGICLCGKNFIEKIQKIDWSKHPEVRVEVKTNALGWSITHITTVFGELQFKREPALDRLGYSNSAAIIGENRLVHYTRAAEHSFNEKVEGEEATRSGIIQWDALCLKGACHIWINGEGTPSETAGDGSNIVSMQIVNCADISEVELTDGMVYYFEQDCKLTDSLTASAGDMYRYKDGAWTLYTGEIYG